MTETVNLLSFSPYYGGSGRQITATSVSARVAIPGIAGGGDDIQSKRIVVSNGGSVSAYVRMGDQNIEATVESYHILPGTKEVLTPPYPGTGTTYIAAITASSSTTINICSGTGT